MDTTTVTATTTATTATDCTKDEAEGKKERQRAHFREGAVIHTQPVYPSRAARRRSMAAAQYSLATAGWLIQMRPPRPGMPVKVRRRIARVRPGAEPKAREAAAGE